MINMISDAYRERLTMIGPLTYQLALKRALLERAPRVVVETGVYNGVSTVLILDALAELGAGTLYSCDPRYTHRGHAEYQLCRAHGRDLDFSRWVFDGRRSLVALPDIPESSWDVFVHDSDHSYATMTFELEYARHRMSAAGLIVCDDIDWPTHAPHRAFHEFLLRHGLPYERHDTAGFVALP